MKVYVSYKQTWVPEDILVKELNLIRFVLNYLDINSFIWYLDENWQNLSANQVLEETYNKIEESDLVLCYINWPDKSEGMFIELWMAYKLEKEIVLFINKNVKDKFWSIYWLSDKIIEFDDLNDLENKLLDFFWIQLSRQQIDNIDTKILSLIAERFLIVDRIGKAKKKLWLAPLQPERWEQVLRSRKNIAKKLGISEKLIEKIWEMIHEEALKREK